MALTDEEHITLQAYFSNSLNEAEEKELMRQLQSNAELLEEFNLMLLTQHALAEETTSAQFESADAHIERVKNLLEQNTNTKVQDTPVKEIFPAKKTIVWLAAASVILFVLVMFLYRQTSKNNNGVENIATKKDSAAGSSDTALVNKPVAPDTSLTVAAVNEQTLFKEFYKRYKGKDDPVEVSIYLLAYYEKNYSEVISATEADYQVRSGSNMQTPKEYMQLYQGLSYMELGQYAKASALFDSVLNSASAASRQYYAGQWYSALALFADKKTSGAKTVLEKIIRNNKSPWRKDAVELYAKMP